MVFSIDSLVAPKSSNLELSQKIPQEIPQEIPRDGWIQVCVIQRSKNPGRC